MARKRRAVNIKEAPWNGDHGTGTTAALAGTELRAIEGSNPNRFARRQRVDQVKQMKPRLSQRQYQAAREIQDAHSRVQMLSSGGELKEQVDSTPRPDATVAAQVDAQSRLARAMRKVPPAMRDVVEHICWRDEPMSALAAGGKQHYNRMADLKVALDLVANHLRY